jgi:hypothetical protein
MIESDDFPNLTPHNHRISSPPTSEYNCIAWASGDTEHWWQPGLHWLPVDAPDDDFTLEALEKVFAELGYKSCEMDTSLEQGFVKVALFAEGGVIYTHAARQLPDGKWTSKLGKGEDIEHDTPDNVAGGAYGEVMGIMRKQIAAGETAI